MSTSPKLVTNRRTFLKTISFGTGGIVIGFPVVHSCQWSDSEDVLWNSFREPDAETRPFFRWWWNGNRIKRDELVRELKIMKEAGAGGVEINPIAMIDVIDHPVGHEIVWLSDEWNERLIDVVAENERTGMVTDLIVGTGWPFGAEFLTDRETIQGVELEVIDLTGPGRLTYNVTGGIDVNSELRQVKLFPSRVTGLEDGIDLFERVEADGTLKIEIPEGAHQLYLVTWRNRFRDVLFGAPGGAGPVLDHFNREAVEKYLNHMSARLKPALGEVIGKRIRAMFCDSIELEGANWTGDLSEVFRKRRGYDLLPYLPLVLNQGLRSDSGFKDILRRVRYDYSHTLAELFAERFIQPFLDWCHENGMLCRYQAYGYPWLYTDLLDGYLMPDIPEGDQWLFNSGWVNAAEIDAIRYAIWNKYAASGGHLMGRRVISSEAMTNTSGVFEASLAYIKQATDLNFVGGINHLVLHGYNYSPPEAGRPGWIRFGTYFHEDNPWWPYARRWFDYASRLSQLFQDADPIAQLAILGPTPDIWSDHGLDRNPWNTTPWYLHALWQALNHHGYASDYVNDTILKQADFAEGEIRFGSMTYHALIVASVLSLKPETAEAMNRFADHGGTILFVGTLPNRSPGLLNHAESDVRVRSVIEQMMAEHGDHVLLVPEPEDGMLIERAGEWMKRSSIQPAVQLTPADPRLFFIPYKKGIQDIFFFANTDPDRTISFEAVFPIDRKTAWRWDPETGERTVFHNGSNISVTLSPMESLLLVFAPGSAGAPPQENIWNEEQYIHLSGPWTLRLEGMDEGIQTLDLVALSDLSQLQGLEFFSGVAKYVTTFELSENEDLLLDLGIVSETSEVVLNGENLGVRWYGRHRYDLSDKVKKGRNDIEIKVTTLAYNYYRSQLQNKMAQYWIGRSKRDYPTSSGILGPVRLLRMKKTNP